MFDCRSIQEPKKGSGDGYSPVESGRGCTDIVFLLLIILSWVAMTGIGLASTGYIDVEYIKKGDPNRLVNGEGSCCEYMLRNQH